MKLLLLNTFDVYGGAALASYRIHTGLRSINLNSTFRVLRKTVHDESVIGPSNIVRKAQKRVFPYLDSVPVNFYRQREKQYFSPAYFAGSIESDIKEINPDVVHLFWVGAGFLRVEALEKIKKPIVWTLHDMWSFTGGCHYDNECGRYQDTCGACPVLHSSSQRDLSNWIWRRKAKAWKDVNITVVATSRWLADCARSSSLFKNRRIEVLPNGVDENLYKPLDKNAAREAFNLPKNKKLVLFSAVNAVSDRRKGFQLLLPALEKLEREGWKDKYELVVLGEREPETPIELSTKIHFINHLDDQISQVLLYSAADTLVLPSIQENLSNVIMESLACGTPAVAFDIGGMPDLIKHQYNGYLANNFDTDDLAKGIDWVLADDTRCDLLSVQARSDAVQRYALKSVATSYYELYQDILK